MRIRSLVVLFVYLFLLIIIGVTMFVALREMQIQTRGVTYGVTSGAQFGVNASLEQYSDDDLQRALALIREGGFQYVRQHFYWNEIELQQNEFQWDKWDRIVARVGEHGLQLVAVLDTTPVWARHPGEADLVHAPPANRDDYARFVAAFTRRYGDRVRYLQLWDNPNVHPFWGCRNADPFDYAALLRAGATAARAVNPQVKIISAGLAPNAELIRGHPDYSDILFLRGMYEAGARDYFDLVGAKPYGMWSGPDDRRVDKGVFNFSRAILLREEMVAYGDANKPIWAVEFGWNALPQDWRGAPSPWGTDTEEVQSARLVGAIQRARSEWAWMPVLIVQTFQPNAPSDDLLWGFALVDKNFQPRQLYSALTRAMAMPVQPASFDFTRVYAVLAAAALVALIAAWRSVVAATCLPWAEAWRALEARFAALPGVAQFVLLALGTIAFYYSPNPALNFVLLAFLAFLFALRLDLGLAITVFTIPFYLLPKTLVGSMQFSMVEVLTLVSVAAWVLRQAVDSSKQQAVDRSKQQAASGSHTSRITSYVSRFTFYVSRFTLYVSRFTSTDLAIILFVLLGILSINTAANFGVAMREFRVIVIEPALLYGLIRASNLTWRGLWRLVDAFILSALAVSLIGLYQFFFTDYVIVGEGVRRVLAVYGSPNNLALYLDRALPLVVALALFVVRDSSRPERAQARTTNGTPRFLYALAALPIALAWYLTYSRGAWLGIAAGLLFIGFVSGRRARLTLIVLLVVGVIGLLPFMQTERAQSFFQTGTGTGFFRVSVWQSAIAMIRDHPFFGVGLDNFLYEYPKYMNPEAWREPNLSHPHNIVLDFWARLGILGVVLLVWLIAEFYRRGKVWGTRGTVASVRLPWFCQNGACRKRSPSIVLPEPLTGERRTLASASGERLREGTMALALMASMTVALAHGMIDAAYFYVDLAFVWMLTLGVMVQVDKETSKQVNR